MRLSHFFLILFIGIALSAHQPFDGGGWQKKVDAELLAKAADGNQVEFLIWMETQANLDKAKLLKKKADKGRWVYEQLQATAKRTQKNVIGLLEYNAAAYNTFSVANAIYAQGTLELIQQLANLDEVAAIVDNPYVKFEEPRASRNAIGFRDGREWGIDKINANVVWDMGYTGQDVVVASADTGVEWEHPAIINQYRGSKENGTVNHNYNWHDAIHEISPLHGDTLISPDLNPCGLEALEPCDDHNHGTHTVGTMVGDDGEGNQIGVAPGAKWVACRNMERGWGSQAGYIECFEFFLAPTNLENESPDPSKAPHVVNNSWGCPEVEGCNPDNFYIMETVVNNLKAAGVVVVASAGNSGSSGCSSVTNPAAIYENSFTVGASQPNDTIANFSSRGPVLVDGSKRLKPNVAAPGTGIRSCTRGGAYATWNGTSMAGPHVAGLVALMISANPALAGQVEEIETIIEATAVPKFSDQNCGEYSGQESPNPIYGYGRVDALAAVEWALALVDTEDLTGQQKEVSVFPNPFKEGVNISFNNFWGKTRFELFNVSGQLLIKEDWNIENSTIRQLDLNGLTTGVYFYKLRSKNGVISGKLVKE